MISSRALKDIVFEARPIIERQIDDAERIAAFREVVTAQGGDWSSLKALIKAQIQDERDEGNTLLTVKEMLLDIVADIDAGMLSPNKAFLIMVRDEDDGYDLNWGACNARSSEMIAMCEVAKSELLAAMGFIPRG